MTLIKNSALIMLMIVLTACSMPSTPPSTPTPTHAPLTTPLPTEEPTSTPTAVITTSSQPEQPDGQFALFMGDYDQAIQQFLTAVESSSEPEIQRINQLGLGQAYYLKGNYGTALDFLRLASESSNPVTASQAFYFLGEVYTLLERYQEALDAYQAYLNLRDGVIDTHILEKQGNIYNLLGQYEQAIEAFQAAFLADSGEDSESLSVKIAVAYDNLGDKDTALALYKDIYNTSDNDYIKAQMDLLIGRIYLNLDQPEQAYPYFQDAVNNYPFTYDAYSALVTLVNNDVQVNEYKRGLVNYFVGQYILAIEAFDRFLAEAPAEFADSALYYKALAQRAAGAVNGAPEYEEALSTWQTLIENYPTSPFYIDAWEDIEYTQWAYMGDPITAAETSLNFVARNPEALEAPDFLFLAGRSYERAGLLAEAAAAWERIANEYPNAEETFRSLYFAGIVQYRLSNWEAAQQTFDRALVLAAQPAEIAAAHLWIGKCQEIQGNIPAAFDSWKLAQTADPFGYYSIRAEDLLLDRDSFADPAAFSLESDLSPYRSEAESWLRTTFNLSESINLESPGMLGNDPRYLRGMEFWSLGQYELAKNEFEALRLAVSGDPAQTFRLIGAFVEIGLYRSAMIASTNLLKSAGLEGADALQAPIYFSRVRFGAYYLNWVNQVAEEEDFSPLLILALIRQESSYEGFIQSRAGARGLMQIMPATGAQLANELGWPENYTEADLYHPYVSLRLGTIYMRRQRTFFEGDLYAMLAAYNGGPGNTIAWKELAPDDPDLLLEVIRIEETRNYIRLITENHYIYRWLYGEEE